MKQTQLKTIVIVSACLMASLTASAQGILQRRANYQPDGRGFVSVNGNNRYTRALYGSVDEWRLETSDRPIFAIYKKNSHRNIRFKVNLSLIHI